MSNTEDRTIPRRTFIRGAAGLIGASALSLPSTVFAGLLSPGRTAVVCGFWTGEAFVAAETLGTGDATLTSVRLTLAGNEQPGELLAIDVHPMIGTSRSGSEALFHAWTAPPNGSVKTRFVMPVHALSGLRLSLVSNQDGAVSETSLPLLVKGGTGTKLREGTYLLALGKADWRNCALDGTTGQVVTRDTGAAPSFQFVTMTVERA